MSKKEVRFSAAVTREQAIVALERLTLTGLEGGRTLLTATSLVDSFEGRDAFVASGMEEGVVEGYQRLDTLLAR